MQKYIRKGTCIELNGNLYKAVDPIEFADCKGCAFDDICNEGSERINKRDLPYCTITDRRDMSDVIFEQVNEGEIFVDENEKEGTKLENEIRRLVCDFARIYDEADIDKHLRRFDSANKKRTSAKKVKDKINKMKDKLYLLK